MYLIFTLCDVPAFTGCVGMSAVVLLFKTGSELKAFTKGFLSDCFLERVARFPSLLFTVIYIQILKRNFPS